MFGPSKEVKELMGKIESGITSNVQMFSENGSSAFKNSEFIDEIISWRENDHPKKLFGGLKKFENLSWMDELLEDYGSKKIAKDMDDPHSLNLGAGWQDVDFENELLLYTYICEKRGFVLTNECLHFFYGRKALEAHVSFRKLAVGKVDSIELKRALAHNDVVLNGEKIGCITTEDDTDVVRALLTAIASRSPKNDNSSPASTQAVVAEESALDKIKKLKDLYDAGVISEEEFEAKKETLMSQV